MKHLATLFTTKMVMVVVGLSLISATVVNAQEKLEVLFEPLKPTFNVGEKIRFKVEGNKQFYLYLFAINDESKTGYVILPNEAQQYHTYKANTEFLVPEKNIEFKSDRPGVERIVMIASTEKLEMDTKEFIEKRAKAVSEISKDIQISAVEQTSERVEQEVRLVILSEEEISEEEALAELDKKACAFVSTNQPTYKAGEAMKIIYGADKAGYVFLYVVEPDGTANLLKKQKVSGNKFYTVKAITESPFGDHFLVALYDEDGEIEKSTLDFSGEDDIEKGIRTVEEEKEDPLVKAVYAISIEEE